MGGSHERTLGGYEPDKQSSEWFVAEILQIKIHEQAERCSKQV